MRFVSLADARSAYEAGILDLHAKIKVRDVDGKMVETTPGRVIFNEVVREAITVVN
jgi:DNA-directed RNA polymerase subunit beta'